MGRFTNPQGQVHMHGVTKCTGLLWDCSHSIETYFMEWKKLTKPWHSAHCVCVLEFPGLLKGHTTDEQLLFITQSCIKCKAKACMGEASSR